MSNSPEAARVAIVMGSDSDWPVMQEAAHALDECGISYDVDVMSAHRTPDEMLAFAHGAVAKGYQVIIAGAGGAAHLPGMIASCTTLPVIGVPVPLKVLDGMDSLLSIVQMPAGIPVATVGIGNAKNAGLLAARILGTHDHAISAKVAGLMSASRDASLEKGKKLNAQRNHKTGF
jgi:5-(carboxyamino)imidazole ribonucleotide mutase